MNFKFFKAQRKSLKNLQFYSSRHTLSKIGFAELALLVSNFVEKLASPVNISSTRQVHRHAAGTPLACHSILRGHQCCVMCTFMFTVSYSFPVSSESL
jgi:hypothetical protein